MEQTRRETAKRKDKPLKSLEIKILQAKKLSWQPKKRVILHVQTTEIFLVGLVE